jgi:hypothetical protein
MKNKKNGQRNSKQQISKPVVKKTKPFWQQSSFIFMSLFVLLGIGVTALKYNKKEATRQATKQKEYFASPASLNVPQTPLDYFKEPYSLMTVWDTIIPFAKENYTEEEIKIQREINQNTNDFVMAHCPISESSNLNRFQSKNRNHKRR